MRPKRAKVALDRAAALEASLQGITQAVARGDLTASPADRRRIEGALAAIQSVLHTENPVRTENEGLV
jgi:hypothetical protein